MSTFCSADAAAQTAPEGTAAPAPPESAPAAHADEPSDPPPMAEPPPAEADEAPPAEANDHMLLVPQHERETGPRTFHRHDGFYLRTNFGLGTLWGGFTTTGTADRHLDAGGSGIGVDLLVGGSPSPGFSIGGGLVGNWLFGAKFDEDGANSTSHDMSSGLVGVFVDGFPRPTGGWHLGGLLGLGGHTLNQGGVASKTGGFGGAIWSGYDQWVGDNFSVGGMLRFTAMRSTGTKSGDDIAASTATLSLMFTALYQ
ncbi:MAG TPA: hypothetical protein VHM70_11830 [Polyangiaceae bacterium]|nr:hypothetical protein [Polyangiaceae bacterium]